MNLFEYSMNTKNIDDSILMKGHTRIESAPFRSRKKGHFSI